MNVICLVFYVWRSCAHYHTLYLSTTCRCD